MVDFRLQSRGLDLRHAHPRLLRSESGGFAVLGYYGLMHLAGAADRRGWRGLADRVRRWVPIKRVERRCSALLGGSFRFITTEAGGCAVDVDNERDLEASRERFEDWSRAQRERAERLYGPIALSLGDRVGSRS